MNRSNFISGILCVAFAVYAYWLSGTVPTGAALDPLGGAYLPRALAVALGLFGAALAITGLLGIQVRGAQATPPGVKPQAPAAPATDSDADTGEGAGTGDSASNLRVLIYAGAMGAYVWLLPVAGFLATSFTLFTVFIFLLGQRNIIRALMVSALLTGGLYGLFGVLFGVRLPAGHLF